MRWLILLQFLLVPFVLWSVRFYELPLFVSAFLLLFPWTVFLYFDVAKKKSVVEAEQQKTREEISLLAAGLAHEIRNPLNTIKFNMRMLEEDIQPLANPELSELQQAIGVEIERLDRLLHSYLEYTTGETKRDKKSLELVDFIGDILNFATEEYRESGVSIIRHLPENPLHVDTDPVALRQVLLNVLINARQAMPEGGAIRVCLLNESNEVKITIEDEGVGIDDSIADKIFSPFFSARKGGSGLGLAVVKRLLDELEHGITIENLRKGVKVSILF
jgi:signal transduction histidine kinase